jgi:hypothetical protein
MSGCHRPAGSPASRCCRRQVPRSRAHAESRPVPRPRTRTSAGGRSAATTRSRTRSVSRSPMSKRRKAAVTSRWSARRWPAPRLAQPALRAQRASRLERRTAKCVGTYDPTQSGHSAITPTGYLSDTGGRHLRRCAMNPGGAHRFRGAGRADQNGRCGLDRGGRREVVPPRGVAIASPAASAAGCGPDIGPGEVLGLVGENGSASPP